MFRFENWCCEDESLYFPLTDNEHGELLRRRKPLPDPEYKWQIMRPMPIGFAVRSLCSFPRWSECDGNIYGLEVVRNDMDELERFKGLSTKKHKVWVFNIATKKWKLRYLVSDKDWNEIPVDLGINFLISHNGSLLCNGSGIQVYQCPLKGSLGLTSMNVQGAIEDKTILGSCKKVGNFVYSIGGQRRHNGAIVPHSDVYRLCLKTRCWETLYVSNSLQQGLEEPPGVNLHELIYDDEFIYVLGGTSIGGDFIGMTQMYGFKYKREFTWHLVNLVPDGRTGSYPTGRHLFACEQHTSNDGTVEAFIVGGTYRYAKCQDFWKLDLSTKQWTCLCRNLPISFYSSECLHNGCLFIFGSYYPATGRINKVLKMWLRIPQLAEICWDVITSVNPNINIHDSKTLLSAGIPPRFVQRLNPPEDDEMIYPRMNNL